VVAARPGLLRPDKEPGRILAKEKGGRGSLPAAAQRVVSGVAGLAELLASSRAAYTGATAAARMEEVDRDQVDAGADSIALQCRQLIARYREEAGKRELSPTQIEHHSLVAAGLDRYLKSVVSAHSEMRAVRVARQVEQRKLSRLELNSVESRAQEIGAGQGSSGVRVVPAPVPATAAPAYWEESEEEELSQEEAALMEMENERLIDNLSSLQNSVDQVQSKVVKIAELQSIFTEKVLQQTDDIEKVHAGTVASTENIKGGNEAVRQAIQNKASYRVYTLFVILVFSFALLFLDWYNP